MRVYRARFEADFSSIDTIIAWVESHIIIRESKAINQAQGIKRESRIESQEDLKANRIRILRKGRDKIALVLCEYIGNIIEHSILCLSKTQLYEWHTGQYKAKIRANVKSGKKYIECTLKLRATHFLLESYYPFIPNYKKDTLKIGKKGKKILSLMGAKSRFVIQRAKRPYVLSVLRLAY